MVNPALGIVVTIGVIIGSALFYYLNSESRQQQYRTGYDRSSNYTYNPPPRSNGPKSRRPRYGAECIICLESLTNGKPTERLRCDHEFHINCVKTWFQTSGRKECPLCRLAGV